MTSLSSMGSTSPPRRRGAQEPTALGSEDREPASKPTMNLHSTPP